MKQLNGNWKKSSSNVFWAEIAPTDHVLQIYDNDDEFLELLVGFVSAGIRANECTIVIATAVHLNLLNEKLATAGFDLAQLAANGTYSGIDAEEALAKFMLNDWPDENLFIHFVGTYLAQAKNG